MAPPHPMNAYARVWQAFRQSEATADGRHDTPYWRSHLGPYALCVVRVPTEAVQPQLDALRADLARLPGVRIHPDHFLHITLQELGFVVDAPRGRDEISGARLEEFVQSAIEPVSQVPAFSIQLGGANSFQDAVFLDVDGSGPLTQLHERLFDVATILRPPDYPYLAHCTVAHYDGTTPAQAAASVIEPWRHQVLGGFSVSEVEIVTLDPAEPYPQLTTYAVIPLRA
jgi:2'-5' RNA ligase